MDTVADPDLSLDVDEASDEPEYPRYRPRTFGRCLALGLGTTLPCPFATCRHSLLSDELAGEMWDGEADLEGRPTCSLAVAAQGRHSSLELATVMSHCETTLEEWSRRSVAAFLAALGIDEFLRPTRRGQLRLRRPRRWGIRLDTQPFARLDVLLDAAFKRGLPLVALPPARHLSRAEAERLYPGRVSPHYGEPRVAADGQAGALPATAPSENHREGTGP